MKTLQGKKSRLPELNLKQDDFFHVVPDEQDLCLTVVWKEKDTYNEQIGPVKVFGIKDGVLKVVNKALPDVAYTFPIKDVRRVIVL